MYPGSLSWLAARSWSCSRSGARTTKPESSVQLLQNRDRLAASTVIVIYNGCPAAPYSISHALQGFVLLIGKTMRTIVGHS